MQYVGLGGRYSPSRNHFINALEKHTGFDESFSSAQLVETDVLHYYVCEGFHCLHDKGVK